MGRGKTTSWSYAEAYPREDEVLLRARERATTLGIRPITPGVAAALTVLTRAARPMSVVEVGTGTGVSGTAILRGLPDGAVLTTVDTDVRALRAARESFREAGVDGHRIRTISGRASLVLPRLSTQSYDMVFLDADAANILIYVDEACRMLKPGGTLLVQDALDQDRVPDPVIREESTQVHREIHRIFRDDSRFMSAIFPTGSGLFMAVKK